MVSFDKDTEKLGPLPPSFYICLLTCLSANGKYSGIPTPFINYVTFDSPAETNVVRMIYILIYLSFEVLPPF